MEQANSSKGTLVLAFSGGLDTSYCAKYLTDLGYSVHSVAVNTGGFDKDEVKKIEERARMLGVAHHETLDETHRFYEECLRYLIYGNVLRNNTYPLSVSAERVFQALALVRYAQQVGASCIAHGSTGAGNDQVRFDLLFHILAPHMEIITPIRDQQLSRQDEVEFLKKHGVEMNWEQAKYSINKGLWGTSVGGDETLTSNKPLPEEAYPSQLKRNDTEDISLEFKQGELKKVNNQAFDHPVEAIQHLESIASQFAIGRDIHVGDTIIGIKGRVGFEAAAPMIILKAHHTLEKHTLGKWQMHWKDQMANWYGMMLHEAQYLDPVMRNIETFLDDTQKTVSGKVFVQLAPYRYIIQGVETPNDLMASKFGSYGEMNKDWSGEDVKGFTKILANSNKIYHAVNELNYE